jgi:hypothetical protein
LTSLLLRHSGFTVERADSPTELAQAACQPDTVLVVVSAAGGDAPGEALGGFQPEAGRPFALVALVSGDPAPARAAGADRVISLPFDPATLVDELMAAVLERHPADAGRC